MSDDTEKQVEKLLLTKMSRQTIYNRLKKSHDDTKLVFFLNNSALPGDRDKFQIINLILALLLTFLTAKKLIAIFSFGTIDLTLMLSLVVPIVNIYVLREVLRFHRLGYQFLFVISILSIIQPENHYLLEMLLLLTMAALSGFLYIRIFPKASLVNPETSSTAG